MMKLLREMKNEDIDRVVAIIDSHDDDDAEEAAAGYRQMGGTYDNFVYEKQGEIIGVTGFSSPLSCDETYWLSWTYIEDQHTHQGHGTKMIKEIIEIIKARGARKLFIKVSDYVDPEDGAIYATALKLYQTLGFKIEITHNHFYDDEEAQLILAMRLQDPKEQNVTDEHLNIQFDGIFEIAETEAAYSFSWHDQGEAPVNLNDVQIGIDAVRNKGARAIFLSFPSNFIQAEAPVLHAGFSKAGQLDDYYEDGIHEVHYSLYF